RTHTHRRCADVLLVLHGLLAMSTGSFQCLHSSRYYGTPRALYARKIHPVSRARADQPRSANMHFAERRHHLLDCVDFFDHKTVRQKSLIDQLHDTFILRLKPDRSKMLAAYLHTVWLRYEWRMRPVAGNRRIAARVGRSALLGLIVGLAQFGPSFLVPDYVCR